MRTILLFPECREENFDFEMMLFILCMSPLSSFYTFLYCYVKFTLFYVLSNKWNNYCEVRITKGGMRALVILPLVSYAANIDKFLYCLKTHSRTRTPIELPNVQG